MEAIQPEHHLSEGGRIGDHGVFVEGAGIIAAEAIAQGLVLEIAGDKATWRTPATA